MPLFYEAPALQTLVAAASSEASRLVERGEAPLGTAVKAAGQAVRLIRATPPRDQYRNRALIEGSIPPENMLVLPSGGYDRGDVGSTDEPYGENFAGLASLASPSNLTLLAVAIGAYFWFRKK